MIKLGIIGAGNRAHKLAERIKQNQHYTMSVVCDVEEEKAQQFASRFNTALASSIAEAMECCEAVYIASSSESHYQHALDSIRAGKHLIVEKPLCTNSLQARTLVYMANEANSKSTVVQPERFNPAYLNIRQMVDSPLFIEAHRLQSYTEQDVESSVVNDLMINDIDIILSLIKSEIKRISATGVKVINDSPDIANARIEFTNGAVANITSSRISLKQVHKMRIFQRELYYYLDLNSQKADVVSLSSRKDSSVSLATRKLYLNEDKQLDVAHLAIQPIDTLDSVLNDFAEAIHTDRSPAVSLSEVYSSMELCERILKLINSLGDE